MEVVKWPRAESVLSEQVERLLAGAHVDCFRNQLALAIVDKTSRDSTDLEELVHLAARIEQNRRGDVAVSGKRANFDAGFIRCVGMLAGLFGRDGVGRHRATQQERERLNRADPSPTFTTPAHPTSASGLFAGAALGSVAPARRLLDSFNQLIVSAGGTNLGYILRRRRELDSTVLDDFSNTPARNRALQ